MITYEDICEQNRMLYQALEVLASQMLDDQPEAEDRETIQRRIEAIRSEIELNMQRIEIHLRTAADYLPPVPKDGKYGPVVCTVTGETFKSIYAAERAEGICEGALKDMLLGRRKNWSRFVIPGAKIEIEYY